MRKAILSAALLLSACGSSSPALAALDTAMTGTWTGTMTLPSPFGEGFVSYTEQATLTVNGTEAVFSGTCPFATDGSATATGSGDMASWSESYACDALHMSSCPSPVVYTITSGSISLDSSTLDVVETATVSDCSTSPVTIHFTGSL
jgi:hypothetical protein